MVAQKGKDILLSGLGHRQETISLADVLEAVKAGAAGRLDAASGVAA